ncbi:MAG: hypothetical protein R3C03_23230 [Pirellulaceae bacterium]
MISRPREADVVSPASQDDFEMIFHPAKPFLSNNMSKALLKLLQTDFCPSWNRYVYWLKQPIGWFVIAAIVGLLIALFLSWKGGTFSPLRHRS